MSCEDPSENVHTVQKQDMKSRYTTASILRSEVIYGFGFQSPGGKENTSKIISDIIGTDEVAGTRILDLGSGSGGTAFLFSQDFNAKEIIGVDYSENMVLLAAERAQTLNISNVSFQQMDVRNLKSMIQDSAVFRPQSFDIIWSRDMILYLDENSKWDLFQSMKNLVKKNGIICTTDFYRNEDPAKTSLEFDEYINGNHYFLVDLECERKQVKEIFKGHSCNIVVEDKSDQFLSGMKEDLQHLVKRKQENPDMMSEADYEYLCDRWRMKINFVESGFLKWGSLLIRT